MTVFWRYWLLQIPGWIVLGAVLAIARMWFGLSPGVVGIVVVSWLVKDVVLYPFLKPHFVLRERAATERILGEPAVTQEALNPRGYVKLGGELWTAELATESAPVAAGETVIVESVDGLTLRVRR